jgi:NADH-quinone oxidoreductase subunit G
MAPENDTPTVSLTVSLTVNGTQVTVPKGTPVIEAARQAGFAVPHYCYHPGLSIAGNCRMCLVKIEKMPKLVTSCTTPAGDGMVVETEHEEVRKAVAGVEEFLLANHPLDCPICDQAGECRLQQYSFKHGNAAGRFREERLKFKKGVDVGRHIILDSERCIICTRCVRFSDEISKSGELGVFQRGLYNEIGIFPGKALDNPYSGNNVDICPVGALTLKEFRFRKRVWYIRDVPSVCGTCATGCNVNVGIAENRVWRLTPRENREVNGWWMCDEGRLSYQSLRSEDRLQLPEARKGDETGPVGFDEAVAGVAALLKGAAQGGAAVVASGSLTVEDFWMLRKLGGSVPGLRVVVPERLRGEDDGFLIRADRTANRAGAAALGLDTDAGGSSSSALMQDAASGKVSVLIALGEEIGSLPGGDAALRKLGESGRLVAATAWKSATSDAAAVRIPIAAWSEFEGTYVSCRGRAQRVRRAVTPRISSLPAWQLLGRILSELNPEAPPHLPERAAQVLREVAEAVPAFEGITWTTLSGSGMQLMPGEGVPEPGSTPRSVALPAWAGGA